MRIRWAHVARGLLFGLIISVLLIDFGLAWIYVGALTEPACPGQPQPFAGFPTPEILSLDSSDGHQLNAWYYPSQNRAAVLTFGGLGGALGNNLPPAMLLLEAGYGVLQMDTRACADPPALVTLGFREGLDASSAIQYLLTRSDVDPSRIGALGFSMGGVAAIGAAARNPEISAVVAEGGYHNLGEDLVEGDNAPPLWTQAFLFTIAGTFWLRTGINPWESSPIEDLPRISPRPVLLIYGEHEVTDGRAYAQFESAAEPKELWVVPDGGHGFNHLVAPEEYRSRVLAFFDASLR